LIDICHVTTLSRSDMTKQGRTSCVSGLPADIRTSRAGNFTPDTPCPSFLRLSRAYQAHLE
jgi:hypothetical protein